MRFCSRLLLDFLLLICSGDHSGLIFPSALLLIRQLRKLAGVILGRKPLIREAVEIFICFRFNRARRLDGDCACHGFRIESDCRIRIGKGNQNISIGIGFFQRNRYILRGVDIAVSEVFQAIVFVTGCFPFFHNGRCIDCRRDCSICVVGIKNTVIRVLLTRRSCLCKGCIAALESDSNGQTYRQNFFNHFHLFLPLLFLGR